MKLSQTVAFLGFGNMGEAILRGLIGSGTLDPGRAVVFDPASERRQRAEALGAAVAGQPRDLAERGEVLMLAVKPQAMEEALRPLRDSVSRDHLVISIAAGVAIASIQSWLPGATRVVRAMPNTPALVGAGAAGYAVSGGCSEDDASLARTVFEAVGTATRVAESELHAVTALSGSGPAYFFYLAECMIDAAESQGLSREQAAALAGQTLLGAGRLLTESAEDAATLRERVTSRGGTTEAALKVMREQGLARLVKAALNAAATRSRQLASE